MASTAIRSIRILRELSGFGLLDATTLEPDKSAFNGTDDVELDAIRAELAPGGAAVTNDRDEPRSGFFAVPGEPETIPQHGNTAPYRARRDDGGLTLTIDLEGYGTADPDDCPTTWLLDAGLSRAGNTSAAAGAGAAAAGQAFTVADASAWQLGGLISATLAGRNAEFSSIVERNTDTEVISHSPAFSDDIDGDTIRPCRTWVGGVGNALLGPSLAFRLDGHKWRSYAFGCRPSSYTLRATGRRVQLVVKLAVALWVDDHDAVALLDGVNVDSVPFRSGGYTLHTLGAEAVISDVIDVEDAAYPRVPGRAVLDVDTWEATITQTLDPIGIGVCKSVLGQTEWEIVDRMTEVKFTVVPEDALDGDYWTRSKRHLTMAFGPGGAAGTGGCLMLPAAFLPQDVSKRVLSNPGVRQELVFHAGGWHGDQGTATAASNQPVRFGLVI